MRVTPANQPNIIPKYMKKTTRGVMVGVNAVIIINGR